MDGLQLLLVIVIVSLTSVLLVVGIQVFFVVREVRSLVRRVHHALDNPTEKVTSFLNELKNKPQ